MADLWRLVRETLDECRDDNIARLGASLAFYTLFSMAPVLLMAVAIAGLVFGRDAASGQVQAQLSTLMGGPGAEVVGQLVLQSSDEGGGALALVIGVATLLVGTSGAFLELQGALNQMWDCPPPATKGWATFLTRRLVSFGLVLVLGILLAVATCATAFIAAVGAWAQVRIAVPGIALTGANLMTSYAVITVLLALLYRVLPDTKVAWGDVWVGAAVASFLFQLGSQLVGVYVGHSTIVSTFGAAGSLVALLVWIYYSAQIVLIGAEFTHVWARTFGSKRRRVKSMEPPSR